MGGLISGESVEGITQNELKDMLRGITGGRVTDLEEWGRDLQERPKLTIMKSLYESGQQSRIQLCMCAQQGAQVYPGQGERGLLRLQLKLEDGGDLQERKGYACTVHWEKSKMLTSG